MSSLFMMHNEAVNIWSHLLGAILYMFLIVYIVFWTVPDARLGLDPEDTILGLSVKNIISMNQWVSKHILWLEDDITHTYEITKMPMIIHMVGNIIAMSMSSIYHLF